MEPSKKLADLNSGWIVCPSKSFPGKFYYFNLLTGEAVWRLNEAHIKNLRNENTIRKITNQSHNYPEPINRPDETSFLPRLPTYGQNIPHDYSNPEPFNWFPVQWAVPMFCHDKKYMIDENTQTSEIECPILVRTCGVPLSARFQNYQAPCLTFDKNNRIVQKPVSNIKVSTPLKEEFKKPPDPPLIPKSKLINQINQRSVLKPNLNTDVAIQTVTKDKKNSDIATQTVTKEKSVTESSKVEILKAEAVKSPENGDSFNNLDKTDLRFLLLAKRRKSMDADVIETERKIPTPSVVEAVKPKKTVLFDLSNLSNNPDDDDDNETDIIPMTINEPKSPDCYRPESPPIPQNSNIELFKISPTNSENTTDPITLEDVTNNTLLTKITPMTKTNMNNSQTKMTQKLPTFNISTSLNSNFISVSTSTPMAVNQGSTSRKMTNFNTLLTNTYTSMANDQSLRISNQLPRKTCTVTSTTQTASFGPKIASFEPKVGSSEPKIASFNIPSRQSTLTSEQTISTSQKTIASQQTTLTNEDYPIQSGYIPLTSDKYREMSKESGYPSLTDDKYREMVKEKGYPPLTNETYGDIAKKSGYPTLNDDKYREMAKKSGYPNFTNDSYGEMARETGYPTLTDDKYREMSKESGYPSLTDDKYREMAKERSYRPLTNETYGEISKKSGHPNFTNDSCREMAKKSGYNLSNENHREISKEMSQKMKVDDNYWKDTWFLIVDTDILLSDFGLINGILESDSDCKLLIPYCIRTDLENLCVGDCQGQNQVFKARQLIRRFSTPPSNYIVQPPKETKNKMGSIINACLKPMDANYFVVLITNNQQLQAAAKALNIETYNLSQIKNKNGYNIKTSPKIKHKSLQSELFPDNKETVQAENKIQNKKALENKSDLKKNLYSKENLKIKELFDEKLKRFYVKSLVMEEKLCSRNDEWLCTYSQIMEDVLNDLLQKNSNCMKDILAPITLNETLNCTKMLYNNHSNIRELIDRLLELFKKIDEKKPRVTPGNFMKMLGYGILLVQDLQKIEPYSEELKDAESYLNLLLTAVENESIEFDPELLKCPVVKRAEIELENSIRQNYTKDVTYILEYLQKHFQSWASYKDFDVSNCNFSGILPNKVLRTSGKNLKMLKIDNNKGMTLTKDNEEISHKQANEPKTIELVHNQPTLEITANEKIQDMIIDNVNNEDKDEFIIYGDEFPQKPIEVIEPKIIRNVNIIDKYEQRQPLDLDLLDYSEIYEPSVNEIDENLQFDNITDNRNDNSHNHNDNSYNQNDNFGISDRVVNLDDLMPQDMDLDTATDFPAKIIENNAYITENIIKNAKSEFRHSNNQQELNSTLDILSESSQSIIKEDAQKLNIKVECVKHNYEANKNIPNNDENGRKYEESGRFYEESGRFYEENGRFYEDSGINYEDNNRIYEESGRNDHKMVPIVQDDSTLDSGFENNSTCAHSVVKIFLNELSTTFKLVYKFVKQFLNDLNDKRCDEMNMESLHDQASKALEHMVAIIQKLKSIIERESPEETKLKILLRNAGVDATADKRVTRYRQVVIKCLEQAKILKNALKIIASTTIGDFDAVSTKESINSSIRYFNIFE